MSAADAPTSLFSEGRLGPITLRNRAVKCGTNEGKAQAGLVTERLIEWHRAFATGGVGMTTLAYCSVSAEGRTFGDQIWLREEAMPGLRRFAEVMHGEGARAAIQLGHAGWFAHPRAIGKSPVGPSRTFSPHAQRFSRAMGPSDFSRMTREFADAASRAVDAGFDALEIHMGHGYLLSQFLSPYNNRRKDAYGGSLENRARFPREVLSAVRDAVGRSVAIYPKLNMEDGFPGGLTLEDGVQVARWIEQDGSVDALQLTGGHTTRTPMFLMRGDVPLREMVRYERDWVRKLGLAVLGRFMIRGYPWSEAFFLASARRFKQAVDLPIMLLGGVTELATMNRAIEEGFAFVALGRALIANPDLIRRMQTGELTRSICNHCNQCVAEMEREAGVRCVLHSEDAAATPG